MCALVGSLYLDNKSRAGRLVLQGGLTASTELPLSLLHLNGPSER
jgi:hypothetical protein